MHGPSASLPVGSPKRDGFGLQPGIALSDAMLASGRAILTEARLAFGQPGKDSRTAVHDLRKAMKRWRAFLRVLQPAFGAEARDLRIAARDLARELSAARDGQSALDALADLAHAETTLPARSFATITERLQALRNGVETLALTPATRGRVKAAVDAAEAALAALPFPKLSFEEIASGLRAGYARVRAALPEDWGIADGEALHELRTRVVVHRYQMELVEPLWPRLGRVWVSEAQRLRERLGTCQDLAVLTRLVGPHQPLAPWRSRLTPLIAARRAVHVRAAERLAGRLFAEKPRAFKRRIAALWKQRNRDAARP